MPVTTPPNTLPGNLSAGNSSITALKELTFNSEVDNGNSGSGTVNIDWTAGDKQKITLTGSCTLTYTAPSGPSMLLLHVIQDGTGGRTISWPTTKWAGAAAPTLTSAASSEDIITIYYNGTSYYGVGSAHFA